MKRIFLTAALVIAFSASMFAAEGCKSKECPKAKTECTKPCECKNKENCKKSDCKKSDCKKTDCKKSDCKKSDCKKTSN